MNPWKPGNGHGGAPQSTRRAAVRRPRHLADVAVHPVLKGGDEGLHLRLRPLHLELHAAIGEILHVAGHLEFPRHLQGGVTESDALDAPGKMHQLVIDIRHRGQPTGGPTCEVPRRFQLPIRGDLETSARSAPW